MAAAREEEGMGAGTGEGLGFPLGRLEGATREGEDVRGDSTILCKSGSPERKKKKVNITSIF
jgi:hypothetical protein